MDDQPVLKATELTCGHEFLSRFSPPANLTYCYKCNDYRLPKNVNKRIMRLSNDVFNDKPRKERSNKSNRGDL